MIIPKICTYLGEGRSRWRVARKRGTPKRHKILFRYPGEGGAGGELGEGTLLFISWGDFGGGSNGINYSGFNENFPAYSSIRVICISRRCLVKYGMQHTQEPQGCTYVNRQRGRLSSSRARGGGPPLPPLLPRWKRVSGGRVVRGDASAWYVRIRVRDHEYFFYLIYYEFYVRPSEHLFV